MQDPSNVVIAACRTPEKAQSLTDLLATAKGKLHIVKIDVSDASSIRAAYEPVASVVGDKGIDVLYNNAGIVGVSAAIVGGRMAHVHDTAPCG